MVGSWRVGNGFVLRRQYNRGDAETRRRREMERRDSLDRGVDDAKMTIGKLCTPGLAGRRLMGIIVPVE
jgi:hypothetical protein